MNKRSWWKVFTEPFEEAIEFVVETAEGVGEALGGAAQNAGEAIAGAAQSAGEAIYEEAILPAVGWTSNAIDTVEEVRTALFQATDQL